MIAQKKLSPTLLGKRGTIITIRRLGLRLPLQEKARGVSAKPVKQTADVSVQKAKRPQQSARPQSDQIRTEMQAVNSADLGPIDWKSEENDHQLGDDEASSCSALLPEKKIRWMMPVSADDGRHAGQPYLVLRGIEFYVSEKDFGRPESKQVARAGNRLLVFSASRAAHSEQTKEMELDVHNAQTVEAERETHTEKTVEMERNETAYGNAKPGLVPGIPGIAWDEDYVTYPLKEEELDACTARFPENKVLTVIPVAKEETADWGSLALIYVRKNLVTINGIVYYVSEPESTEANARKAARKGGTLHVWAKNDAMPFQQLKRIVQENKTVPIKTEDMVSTVITPSCSVAYSKQHNDFTVNFHESGCMLRIKNQVLGQTTGIYLISDEGWKIVLRMDKRDNRVFATVETNTMLPKTKAIASPDVMHNAAAHPHDAAWTHDCGAGFKISRAQDMRGNMVYWVSAELVDKEKGVAAYSRFFTLNPDQIKTLQVGNEIEMTVKMTATETIIGSALPRMDINTLVEDL